jgi:hypothetical protein
MMIVEAIRSAPTQHAVQFLVTAYIESLRHFERTCGVPAEVLDLPIAGSADLEARLTMLHQHTIVPFEAIVAVSELASVLDGAIERLSSLDEHPLSVMPHARSDNPRSALSV